MNKYIKMFMDDHDSKVEERFKLKDHEGECWFNCDGILLCCVGGNCSYETVLLLNGDLEVEKIKKEPWKPKENEPFFFVNQLGDIVHRNRIADKSKLPYLIKHNLVFKTEEEAKDYKWFLESHVYE